MLNRQKGIAMLEVLVTAIILAIGISGIGVLLLQAVKSTQDTSQQTQGMWMIQDFVGRIRANPIGARLSAYESTGVIACAPPPATMCADHRMNGTFGPADVCDPTQMAAYDIWVTMCGLQDNIFDSASDFLINPVLNSGCILYISRQGAEGSTNDCVRYNVELNWETKRRQGGDSDKERIYAQSYNVIVELD